MSPPLVLEVPGTLAAVDQAMEAVRIYVAAERPGARDYELCLVLREALINAVCHGGGEPTRLSLWVDGPSARVRVRDPGPGFDWRAALARLPGDRDEGGRGLWMMRQWAEDLAFNEEGNELHLCCRLASPAEEPGPGPERSAP